MCEWMDGWMDDGWNGSALGCAAHVKEDEGMEWMGWDGMVRQGERLVRYAAGCGYGIR